MKPMSAMDAHTASAKSKMDNFAGRFHAGFANLILIAIAAPQKTAFSC